MIATHDIEGDAEKQRLLAALERPAARAKPIAFWWRDDDAVTDTPQLDRLLALAASHDLPLALAVIPENATGSLARRLEREPRVAVLQHGWRHANHAAAGEKKIELGGRPAAEVLDELRRGLARLTELFPKTFLPVLVPPWNRIADAVREARREAGLIGLSTFGPAPPSESHCANTHLDIFDWRPTRPVTRARAFAILADEIERRLAGDPEPVGIMTHHLVHEAQSWALLEEIFGVLATHPGVKWPETKVLFALT
jgi:peptidoglycan/xylan/chitin deacetylase (PgdA/CDA1 family)